LADLLIKPIEETAPTVRIHIPMTPVSETPPILTPHPGKVRPLKLAGPAQSPLVPNQVPPKLKLRASTPTVVRTPMRTPSVEPRAEPQPRAVAFAVPALPLKAKPVPKAKPAKPNGVPKPNSVPKPTSVPKPNGVPKPVHALKAQGSGMTLNDLRATRSALKKLLGHKHGKIFLRPVDPIRDNAPKCVYPLL
jgi:transcription initiation factor TFIID subunit 2